MWKLNLQQTMTMLSSKFLVGVCFSVCTWTFGQSLFSNLVKSNSEQLVRSLLQIIRFQRLSCVTMFVDERFTRTMNLTWPQHFPRSFRLTLGIACLRLCFTVLKNIASEIFSHTFCQRNWVCQNSLILQVPECFPFELLIEVQVRIEPLSLKHGLMLYWVSCNYSMRESGLLT